MSNRYSIRKSTYRGEPGFVLTGPGVGTFDTDREVLEAMASIYRDSRLGRRLAGEAASLVLIRKVQPADAGRAYLLVLAEECERLQDESPPDGGARFILGQARTLLQAAFGSNLGKRDGQAP